MPGSPTKAFGVDLMKLRSPAKLNLFLNVLSRRRDGYHRIETLFERIDLCDELELLNAASGIHIETSSENIPKNEKNLGWRAAALLKKELKLDRGILIRIKKNIPVSAGLGGGSSNAASVLLGLNKLWKLNLSQKKLVFFASKLGSDVAFFVLDVPYALGSGRGEILKKIKAPFRKNWHVLVKPSFGISTQASYKALNLRKGQVLTPPKANAKMLLHSIHKGDSKTLGKLLINSLEVTLNKRVTEILKIKSELVRQGALGALMSGSGSCVFGIFSSKNKALQAADHLRKAHRAWMVFVASTY